MSTPSRSTPAPHGSSPISNPPTMIHADGVSWSGLWPMRSCSKETSHSKSQSGLHTISSPESNDACCSRTPRRGLSPLSPTETTSCNSPRLPWPPPPSPGLASPATTVVTCSGTSQCSVSSPVWCAAGRAASVVAVGGHVARHAGSGSMGAVTLSSVDWVVSSTRHLKKPTPYPDNPCRNDSLFRRCEPMMHTPSDSPIHCMDACNRPIRLSEQGLYAFSPSFSAAVLRLPGLSERPNAKSEWVTVSHGVMAM
mmetsp:Transcript_68442/g.160897  ORF Transcript_68442/g.160897 Transcript_68442/m.160897 type:complete len:253 (+) Transcript_68442:175-933(+)